MPGPVLREVICQRDPAERAALAALRDGDAETYLENKASAITIHASEQDALAAAPERWAALRDDHGPSAVVMIARDNAARDQLNTAARARLLADGQLSADQRSIGGREWAVGDRVIARHNDRRGDVDNGTVATVTALLPGGAGLEITTDGGQARALKAVDVAEHLQHGYAITGHSSQGATVEAAIVVGRPEEFTREWAYTALSRARGQTALELHRRAPRRQRPLRRCVAAIVSAWALSRPNMTRLTEPRHSPVPDHDPDLVEARLGCAPAISSASPPTRCARSGHRPLISVRRRSAVRQELANKLTKSADAVPF